MGTGVEPCFLCDHAAGPQHVAIIPTSFRSVFKPLSTALLMIGFLMAGITARKQALHDMFAGCLVLRR